VQSPFVINKWGYKEINSRFFDMKLAYKPYLNFLAEKGFIEIFEDSAKDGSGINKITIPVIFEN
jgi:hypothetical protein